MSIDLNCDLGEGSGADEQLMPLITSANIACGGHAGDDESVSVAVELAKRFGVNIGAHPSLPDRQNFGRQEMTMSINAIEESVIQQILMIKGICERSHATLRHVKPHGALYNLAVRDSVIANVIGKAIARVDSTLVYVGLANSCMRAAAEANHLRFAGEFFADRTYQPDGSLTPRSQSGALIHDPQIALSRVLRLIQTGEVATQSGAAIQMSAITICVHGDGASAVPMLTRLRSGLELAKIQIRPII